MTLRPQTLISAAGLALLAGVAIAAPMCGAESGTRRGVLLELYTSEGCDSCPPADRRLSQLGNQAADAGRVVPLAFHVDYWDRLGWADRFASPLHTRRQYAMAALVGSRLVYTPQFLRNGRDWRSPGSPLDGVGDKASPVRIALLLGATPQGQLALSGEISAVPAAADVYLAVYENNLESRVQSGENAGRTLRHDYVVRRLIGPLAPDPAGRLSLRRQIVPDAGWKPADLGVVVFVQDRATGEILQALQRHAC